MKHFIIILTTISLVVVLGSRCNIDHGIAPLPGKLIATVYFRGTAPENTQGIYLVVIPQFPPHAINELYHSPNSLPLDQDTVVVEMELPFGKYEAISLWWYSKETESNLADVIALPLDPFNNLLPLGFEINQEQPIAQMDLFANWSRVDRNAAIEGTIYFNGPFPENTLATAVAAYKFKPENNVDFLVWLKSIDFTIDSNPYPYRLPVRNGNVDYIAVFWLPERANLTDFKTIGVYEDPEHPGQPAKLSIRAGEVKTGIDIHAD
ncbi:MAG: hypothetical protein SCK70_11970, partial [bacterium]|nr:hypothetical protein [bacterium]